MGLSLISAKWAAVAVAVVGAVMYVMVLKYEIGKLEHENAGLLGRITSMEAVANAAVEQAKVEIVEVEKEVKVIEVQTQVKIQKVKEYIRDENKTECANAMDFARSYF